MVIAMRFTEETEQLLQEFPASNGGGCWRRVWLFPLPSDAAHGRGRGLFVRNTPPVRPLFCTKPSRRGLPRGSGSGAKEELRVVENGRFDVLPSPQLFVGREPLSGSLVIAHLPGVAGQEV